MPLFPSLLFSALACSPNSVSVEGLLYDARGGKARPLVGAQVAVLELDGSEYDSVRSDRRGNYSAVAPFASAIHLTVEESTDGVVSSFTGASGTSAVFKVIDDERPAANVRDDGVDPQIFRLVYGVRGTQLDSWRATYDGCPGVGEGGLVIGQVSYDLWGSDGQEPPAVDTPTALLVSVSTGDEFEPCYLNDSGTSYDAAAEHMGLSQDFAFFGLEQGLYELQFQWQIFPGGFERRSLTVWVPQDGVAPRFPAWLPFPIF